MMVVVPTCAGSSVVSSRSSTPCAPSSKKRAPASSASSASTWASTYGYRGSCPPMVRLDYFVELRPLRDDDGAPLGHVETLAVGFPIEPDDGARRDLDVFVDDGAPDLCVPAHDHMLEEHALFDLAERVHAATDAEHAPVDAPAGDDATVADHRIGCDTDARLRLVAEHELGGRVMRSAGANRPPEVVEVELRMDLDEIHLRFPIRVDGPDVSPISTVGPFFFTGNEILREVVRNDRRALSHQTRQDVAAEIVTAVGEQLVRRERANQHLSIEHVVAHRGQAASRIARHRGGVVDLFVKLEDPPADVDLEN